MKTVRVLLAALLGATLVLPQAALAAGSATVQSSSAAAPSSAAPSAVSPTVQPGGNPLSPGFPQPSVSVPTTPTAVPTITNTTTAGGGSGISGSSAIVIAVGALVVLGGISFFIWRDARRRAPTRGRPAMADGEGRRTGSKQRAKPRKLSPAERKRRKRGRAR